VHSTNLLERLGTELKRRSAVVGIFSHRRAVLRLWGDLRAAQHDEWRVSAHRDRNETSLRKLFIHEAEEGTPAGLLYWVADTGRYPSSAPACTDCARPSTNTQVRRMVRQVEGTMAEENKDIAGVIALPPLIYLGPLVVGLVLHAVRPIAIVPRVLSRVLGVALIGSALAVGATAFAALRRADTPPDPREPTQAIVATGPYRFTRNPIYLAFTLLYAGITLVANARWPALLLPAVLIVMRRGVIDREERYLEQRFGDEYRQYKARVRRWV